MIKFIARWLENYQIKVCALCKKVIFHKDARYKTTNLGFVVPLCETCCNNTFYPFTGGEANISR